MGERLVSEAIQPVKGTFDAAAMARGEPGVPGRFVWRDREHRVTRILETWKDIKPGQDCPDCMYLKKHWYRIITDDGTQMRLYFDRQPRRGKSASVRWFVFSVGSPDDDGGA